MRLAMTTVTVGILLIAAMMIFHDKLPWAAHPTGQPAAPAEEASATTEPPAAPTTGGTGGSSSSGASSAGPALYESAHPYAPGQSLSWPIQNTGALEMRLHFSRVAVGSGDRLWVEDRGGISVVSFGDGAASQGAWTDWVGGDSLTVRLDADSSGNAWGFAVDKVETRWTLPSGTYPESFHPYGDNTRYLWEVSRAGASKLRLYFARIELGQGDYLIITDKAGNVLQRFPEAYVKDDVWSDWLPTSAAVLDLRTNYGDCRYGFKVDAVESQ